jgi:hypothetical protein
VAGVELPPHPLTSVPRERAVKAMTVRKLAVFRNRLRADLATKSGNNSPSTSGMKGPPGKGILLCAD